MYLKTNVQQLAHLKRTTDFSRLREGMDRLENMLMWMEPTDDSEKSYDILTIDGKDWIFNLGKSGTLISM